MSHARSRPLAVGALRSRIARTVALGAIFTVLLTGCTSSPAPSTTTDQAEAAGDPAPTHVSIGDDVVDPPTRLEGAGFEMQIRSGASVDFPTRDQAATLLSATRKDGTSLAGIVISANGFDREPVVIDYHSTAFAMLLMSPEFVTDNLYLIAYLRGLAQQSGHFEGLADALKARDVHSINTELSALGDDVYIAAQQDASAGAQIDDVSADRASTVVTPTRFALASTTAASAGLTPDCDGDGDDGLADNVGLCMTLDDATDDDLRYLKVENRSRSWVALYSDPDLVSLAVPDALAAPRVFGGVAISEVAENIFKLVSGRVATAVCSGLDWLGISCDSSNLDDYTNAIYKMSPDPGGEALVLVSPTDHIGPTYVVSGMGGSALDATPVPAVLSDSGKTIATMLNVWSMVVQPTLNVTAGIKANSAPDHDKKAASPSEKEKERADRADLMAAIRKAIGEDDAIQPLVAAMASHDAGRFTSALGRLGKDMLGSGDLMAAVAEYALGSALDDFVIDAAVRAFAKNAEKAIPVVGQVIAALDTANAMLAAGIQAAKFLTTYQQQPAASVIEPLWYHAVKGDPAALAAARHAVLSAQDPANREYGRLHPTAESVEATPESFALSGGHFDDGRTVVDFVGALPTESRAGRYAILFSHGIDVMGGPERSLCYFYEEAPYLIPRFAASTCLAATDGVGQTGTHFMESRLGESGFLIEGESLVAINFMPELRSLGGRTLLSSRESPGRASIITAEPGSPVLQYIEHEFYMSDEVDERALRWLGSEDLWLNPADFGVEVDVHIDEGDYWATCVEPDQAQCGAG